MFGLGKKKKKYQFILKTPQGVYKSRKMDKSSADEFINNVANGMKTTTGGGWLTFIQEGDIQVIMSFDILKQTVMITKEF